MSESVSTETDVHTAAAEGGAVYALLVTDVKSGRRLLSMDMLGDITVADDLTLDEAKQALCALAEEIVGEADVAERPPCGEHAI